MKDFSLDDLKLSVKARRLLDGLHVSSLEQLKELTQAQIYVTHMRISAVGVKSFAELINALQDRGVFLEVGDVPGRHPLIIKKHLQSAIIPKPESMINSKIYVVTNIDSDEEQIKALFSQPEYAEAFIKRSPAMENKYKIISLAIDQDFTSSPDKNPYGVILDPENEDYCNVHSCTDQDEEAEAAKTTVTKLDDHFYMMLYAVDEIEAEQVARKHLKVLLENGEWVHLKNADDWI